MPKTLMVNPAETRASRVITLSDIPVHQYNRTVTQELKDNKLLSKATLLRMYRDMALIREFESMLDSIASP